ncbi:MAG: hypothetical protein KAS32_13880 [Candidatus Peribacteraceae bacterium]|nr:hypothetical protein [Candidatus Peribacteraceae bacterium]
MIDIICLKCKHHLEVDKIPKTCPLCSNEFHPKVDERDNIIEAIYNVVTRHSTKGFCYCDEHGWTSDEKFGDPEDEIRPYEIEDPYSFL